MPDLVRRPRKRPFYAPPYRSARLYLRLAPRDVAMFKFMLEAHDNLGLLTVVDRFSCVVRLLFSPDGRGEVDAFLASAAREFPGLRLCFDPQKSL